MAKIKTKTNTKPNVKSKDKGPSKKWLLAPNSIVVSGVRYEKIFEDSVEVALDLTDEELSNIREAARKEGCLSEGEYVRKALLTMLEKEDS